MATNSKDAKKKSANGPAGGVKDAPSLELVLKFDPAWTTVPMLRVEVGQHTALITSLDVDRSGRFFVTGSKDKTARIWSLPEARLLRVIRAPLVQGDGGAVTAVAINPDDRTVVVGSYVNCMRYFDVAYVVSASGDPITLGEVELSKGYLQVFDTDTGQLIRDLPLGEEGKPGLRGVLRLAFSPDGRYLAASGHGGIRVWQTRDWQEIFGDQYEGTSYDIAFDGAGRLATTSDDGFLRVYESPDQATEFHLVGQASAPKGSSPHGLAFSPDGKRLAIGFGNISAVMVVSVADLSDVSWLSPSSVDNLGLAFVTWSADGRFLYAAGEHNEDGMRLILRWCMTKKTRPKALRYPRNTVMGLKPFGKAGVLFAAADPCFGGFDGKGKEVFSRGPGTAIMRGKLGDAFTVSSDGRSVRFGLEYGEEMPVRFDLDRRQVMRGAPADETFAPARTVDASQELLEGDWKHTPEPKLKTNGRSLSLNEGEYCRSVAIAPNGASFVLGSDWYLRLFDRNGTLKWEQPTPSACWGVNIPLQGDVVLAAYGDGTVRWHRLEDGLEILILFVHPDGERWIAWTQEGYYDASVGADGLIGWHIARGENEMADFLPVWQFHDRFCRPDVIARVLDTLNVGEAVRQADSAANRETQAGNFQKLLQENPLPIVQLYAPHDGYLFKDQWVVLHYLLHCPTGSTEVEVRALINGHGDEEFAPATAVRTREGECGEVAVCLPPQNVVVSLEARVGATTLRSEAIQLLWRGPAPGPKPTLYVLAVGVSKYKTCKSLQFAQKDAEDFVRAMLNQEGKQYGQVKPRILPDADRMDIIEGLQWLAKQDKKDIDITILFLSGHGLTDEKNSYYFLPNNVDLSRLRDTSISQEMLASFLGEIKGIRLVFIDTCHAGAATSASASQTAFARPLRRVDIDSFTNQLWHGAGAYVITASTGTQDSVEDPRWKNGAFTEALLEGFDGKAHPDERGVITLSELNAYICRRVRNLTGGRQTPMFAGSSSDFPIAQVQTSGK
jgi:WD40 repeat protein